MRQSCSIQERDLRTREVRGLTFRHIGARGSTYSLFTRGIDQTSALAVTQLSFDTTRCQVAFRHRRNLPISSISDRAMRLFPSTLSLIVGCSSALAVAASPLAAEGARTSGASRSPFVLQSSTSGSGAAVAGSEYKVPRESSSRCRYSDRSALTFIAFRLVWPDSISCKTVQLGVMSKCPDAQGASLSLPHLQLVSPPRPNERKLTPPRTNSLRDRLRPSPRSRRRTSDARVGVHRHVSPVSSGLRFAGSVQAPFGVGRSDGRAALDRSELLLACGMQARGNSGACAQVGSPSNHEPEGWQGAPSGLSGSEFASPPSWEKEPALMHFSAAAGLVVAQKGRQRTRASAGRCGRGSRRLLPHYAGRWSFTDE